MIDFNKLAYEVAQKVKAERAGKKEAHTADVAVLKREVRTQTEKYLTSDAAKALKAHGIEDMFEKLVLERLG